MHNVLQLESLQQENEQLKDKLEEVTLDLEILKNEVSEGGKIIFQLNINELSEFLIEILIRVISPFTFNIYLKIYPKINNLLFT